MKFAAKIRKISRIKQIKSAKIPNLTFAMENRIRQMIEYYGLNPYAMEQKILVSEGTISKFLARKIGMKVPTLQKILENFPNISPDWLLLGKGEMLRRNECFCCPSCLGVGEKVEKNPAPDHVGIFVNHGGNGDTYHNHDDLLQLVVDQQHTIHSLTEQNRILTEMIANK